MAQVGLVAVVAGWFDTQAVTDGRRLGGHA